MQFRAWTLLLALTSVAWAATPFAVNHTELRRTHPLRNGGARPPGTRRRARDTRFFLTPPPATHRTLPTSKTVATTAMPLLPAPSGPYWANASLLGAEVSCDAASKRCLAIGRLPHAPSGRCYPVGDRRPCGDRRHIWALDAHALREGRVQGTCRQDDTCSFAMAFDGVCYNSTYIYSRLCDSRASIARHPTGRWECRCAGEGCPPAETHLQQQPAAAGKCFFPDFRVHDLPSFRVACTPAEAECLSVFALPFGGKCVQPLTRSVCPEGQWLTLDERAAESGRLRARCASERPCGKGAQLLRVDGRCHSEKDLRSTLCAEETILHLPTGQAVCTTGVQSFELGSVVEAFELEEAGTCKVEFWGLRTQSHVTRGGMMECAQDDDGNCSPEVRATEPLPVFVSEDE